MTGFNCCGEGDKAGELLDNWLECLKPPAEAKMANKIWIKSGHTLNDLVDTSIFPPKINEGLYAEIMKLYPKDGILFNDGTGSGPDMTREEWIATLGADPLAQLAWQRRER